MLFLVTFTAVLGVSVSAAPLEDRGPHSPGGYGPGGSGGQIPFKFPLQNGFPNIKVPSPALTAIEKQAHGTLPNGALPTSVGDATATTLQLIAFNEIFEVAFFTSLLNNITHGHYREEVGSPAARSIVLQALTAVRAQEELHAIGANAILASAKRETILPCKYIFPSSSFESAITVASLFNDVVLGTLQDALANFAAANDTELIPLVGGVIGQEGEQNGFFRTLGRSKKIPSQLPFLSRSAGPFAYSALHQNFVFPGSCPNAHVIDIPIFPPLRVLTPPQKPVDQTVRFSFTASSKNPSTKGLSLVYINQQNLPVVEKLQNVVVKGREVTFQAAFPGGKNLMNGLTIAAVTQGAGPFADADAVATATKYGPGLIEIG